MPAFGLVRRDVVGEVLVCCVEVGEFLGGGVHGVGVFGDHGVDDLVLFQEELGDAPVEVRFVGHGRGAAGRRVGLPVGADALAGEWVDEGAFADDGVGEAAVLQRALGGHGGDAVVVGHLPGGG
jgi:hypothetical protein